MLDKHVTIRMDHLTPHMVVTLCLFLSLPAMVRADIGYSDSAAFSLNLLTQRGSPTTSFADSSQFAINLLQVRRAWTDSSAFPYDLVINHRELSWLAAQWLSAGCAAEPWAWCWGADWNHSTSVDFVDFALLASHWMEGI
jgi:hypothetical protein